MVWGVIGFIGLRKREGRERCLYHIKIDLLVGGWGN